MSERGMAAMFAFALAVACGPGPPGAEVGIGARFGDLVRENVEPGRTYNLREVAHVPLGIENRGDAETEISVDFERPSEAGLSKGYEPVPDPGWFKSIPTRVRVGPHG